MLTPRNQANNAATEAATRAASESVKNALVANGAAASRYVTSTAANGAVSGIRNTIPAAPETTTMDEAAKLYNDRQEFKQNWTAARDVMQSETKGKFHDRAGEEDFYHREKLVRDIGDLTKVSGLLGKENRVGQELDRQCKDLEARHQREFQELQQAQDDAFEHKMKEFRKREWEAQNPDLAPGEGDKLLSDLAKDKADFENTQEEASRILMERQVQEYQENDNAILAHQARLDQLLTLENGIYNDLTQSVKDWDFSEKANINLQYDILNGSSVSGLGSIKYRDAADKIHADKKAYINSLVSNPHAHLGELNALANKLRNGMLTSEEDVAKRVG